MLLSCGVCDSEGGELNVVVFLLACCSMICPRGHQAIVAAAVLTGAQGLCESHALRT